MQFVTQFAAEAQSTVQAAADHAAQPVEAAGGLAALGLNWPAFLFQLITFVLVLLLLRQFVFKKLVATLEARRQTVENSLAQAAETEKKLANAKQTIVAMLAEARMQADAVVATGHKEAAQLVEAAETKAAKRAEHLVKEAHAQLEVEVAKARQALRAEIAQLVASATERIIGERVDGKRDEALIARALEGAKK